MKILIPLDVPAKARKAYESNYKKATKSDLGRLMLFAGDQKIEHLNRDFFGFSPDGPIPLENNNPEHLFKIASQAHIGVFATQLGMIARYGMDYPKIDYLIKLNSKTNIVPVTQAEPLSRFINTVEQVVELQNQTKLSIVGAGYTIYMGSEYENIMLTEASQMIDEAHKHGLITVLWIYPRGKAVKDEKDPNITAGATGLACSLGSDFVKVIPPETTDKPPYENLKQAVGAAGRTKVICSGESLKSESVFLTELYNQIHTGGASGSATGRNIHERPLKSAIKFANAISAITINNKSVKEALDLLK